MFRSILILLMGSGVAQLGPLLMAPLLSRLFAPEVFGLFHLATAVATNLAVVACARYEFALPMARDALERQRLHRLSLRVLMGVVVLCAVGSAIAAGMMEAPWPLAVPPTVAALGYLSLWTLRATAAQAVRALAWARVLQFWGCGLLQAALGALQAGLWGLLAGPVVAAAAAAWGLRMAVLRGMRSAVAATAPGSTPVTGQTTGQTPALPSAPEPTLTDTARHFRDFPLLNTPHAFLGALQDTLSVALIAAWVGPAAAGVWAVSLRLLKAPATLAGSAVSQVLYPRLGAHGAPTAQAVSDVRRVMAALALAGGAWAMVLALWGPHLMPWLLGPGWEDTGPLARALALYIGVHLVASPLAVVTMAWNAQAWALRAALWGQGVFVASLGGALWAGASLAQAAQGLSWAMSAFFGWYFWRLARWPVTTKSSPA